MATHTALPYVRAVAVSAGAAVALVPALGPFVALVATFGVRWRIRRSDGLWWLSALLLALPWIGSGDAVAGILSAGQVLAAWLLFRGAEAGRRSVRDARLLRDAGVGLMLGLVGVTISGLTRIDVFDLAALTRLTDVIAWREHPTLFGHSVLTVSALVAVTALDRRASLLALSIGAVGVVATGALEAVAAWLLVALVVAITRPSARGRALHMALFGLVAIVVVTAGPRLGLGATGFLVDLERNPDAPNLLQGTEVAGGAWWHTLDVDVTTGSATLDDMTLVSYTVTKRGQQGWARLQQRSRLDSGETTVSVYLRSGPGTRPGIDLWGRIGSGELAQDFNAYATLRDDGAWRANATGALEIVAARRIPIDESGSDEGWIRAALTVRYDGPSTDWYVGVTPDRRDGVVGSRTTFAGLQVHRGADVGTYVPAPAERGLDLRTARLTVWGDALEAIAAGPWHGWGSEGFLRAAATLRPDERLQRAFPAHAHNAFLDVWVERGVLGLAALLLLVAVLAARAARARDAAALAVVAAVVLMNAFDTSLLYGGVLYPLAVLLGWRAGAFRAPELGTNLRSQAPARFGLVLGDLVSAWLAMGCAAAVGAVFDGRLGLNPTWEVAPTTLAYLSFLWPLLAAREGLYPGYGISPANELRRSVQSAAMAGALFVVATRLVPEVVGVPLATALVVALAGTLVAPLVRGLTKRLLLALGAWGKPVLIVGGGLAAQRVTRALRARALDGLQPVAVFSDDDTLGERDPHAPGVRSIGDVPIEGVSADAIAYAQRHGVDHAVVALPDADPDALQALVERLTRAFRRVQFIPNLATMPSHGVYATDLDHMLALELRVGLLDAANRIAKRTLDLVGVLAGSVVLVPLTALLALAIRVDSPGPALYRQERIGLGGRRFQVWKFRTMVVGADGVLADLLARDPRAADEWARHQKLAHDPRVTRVGRWLRRTSLDELPQLWNVLRGEMSVVGPRPIVDEEVAHYGQAFELFTAVRPGITGYWQVSGRSRVPYPERVEYDTYYVRNWSIWLDAVILARTVDVVLRREGAY